MDNSPLVSILIPLYNAERYIAETLDNCLAQTYPNIEVIVVDDGSSDNSLAIARKYAEKHENIKVFAQENAGAPRARNLAFEKCSGDYIQYLDADDLMSENKIASQMALAERYGDEAVYSCRFEHFCQKRGDGGYVWREVDRSFDSGLQWLIASWSGMWMGVIMSWLTPRQLIEKAGPWNESLTKNQDGEFFSRVLLYADKVVYSDDAVVYYRLTGSTSVASQFSQKSARSTLDVFKLYETHTKDLDHPQLKKALAYNYLDFIRSYYPHFPELIKEAEASIYQLGFTYRTLPIPGKLAPFAKIIGSNNVIRLQYWLGQLVNS